jgi:hypothetical protein
LQLNIYEWRIYTLTGDGQALDVYFSDVLQPALKKLNVKSGFFKLLKEQEKDLRYTLFVYKDLSSYLNAKHELWKNTTFVKAAAPFFEATAPRPVYSEMQTYLCEAFEGIPSYMQPSSERTILEFRNYKSPNEEANLRKIKMFESGETAIFDKSGINSVCYGNVLAGPRMPSLIYLTWHKDEASRNEAWQKFSSSDDWKKMSSLPEYANTATDNKVVLLSPLSFSDV